MLPTGPHPDRRPSIVYEEDIAVSMGFANKNRRGSMTMTVRITDEDDEGALADPANIENRGCISSGNSFDDSPSNSEGDPESRRSSRGSSTSLTLTPTLTSQTLRVPRSLQSSSTSLEDDPREVIRRRSLPKARSSEHFDQQGLYTSNFLHPRRLSMNSSLFLENFIKGRRSSTGASSSGGANSLAWSRRRLSDQVSICTSMYIDVKNFF